MATDQLPPPSSPMSEHSTLNGGTLNYASPPVSARQLAANQGNYPMRPVAEGRMDPYESQSIEIQVRATLSMLCILCIDAVRQKNSGLLGVVAGFDIEKILRYFTRSTGNVP